MAFKPIFYLASLALITLALSETTNSARNTNYRTFNKTGSWNTTHRTANWTGSRLHLATKGLLQIHPSFTGEGITLYPGHHPDHNASDLSHLNPQVSQELYYSQEGHRSAYHGAKHGSMKANFTRPTIVLDHSSHVKSVKCKSNGTIQIGFDTPEAFQMVKQSWNLSDFHLVTFHVGCGDETSGKRSYFHAKKPLSMDSQTLLTVVPISSIKDEDALDSGEISWGTYQHPDHKKRVPVLGHIRLNEPADIFQAAGNSSADDTSSIDPLIMSTTPIVDLNEDVEALGNFFYGLEFDTSDIDVPVDADDDPDFISDNGVVPFDSTDSTDTAASRRDVLLLKRSRWDPHRRVSVREISKRGLFDGIWNGIKAAIKSVATIFETAAQVVTTIVTVVVEFAIISAKLIAVPFGVPFNHSFHNDFQFDYQPQFGGSNRPPTIFGIGDGFEIASEGTAYAVQCAKCGITGDFSVDGRLAFSIQNGITEGLASLVNNNPFTIDAQFGISVDTVALREKELFKQELGALPLSPLTIPGIITFGPQISVSAEIDMSLNGKAELLLGGSLSISPGTAALSLVDKNDNKLEGLVATFTPVAKLSGSITATLQLGIPIAIEIGLDVLNGKFKKTVGFIDKPSVYASAIISHNEGNACDDGVELRLGVKNRIYIAALDSWDYTIRTDILYEKSLTCITADGFDSTAVKGDVVFNSVVGDSGGVDVGTTIPEITDVAGTIVEKNSKTGFRIIMDESQSSILVAGTDGFVYLVDSEENYDISSPWGTIDTSSYLVNLDIFGRILGSAFSAEDPLPWVGEVRLFKPSKVPSIERAVSLVIMDQKNAEDNPPYALTTGHPNGELGFWFPTVCRTAKGLRLYVTSGTIDTHGTPRSNTGDGYSSDQDLSGWFSDLGIETPFDDCRTIRLTSQLQG